MLLKRLHVDDWVYVAVDSAHEVVLTGLFSQVGVREPLPRVRSSSCFLRQTVPNLQPLQRPQPLPAGTPPAQRHSRPLGGREQGASLFLCTTASNLERDS